MTKPPPGREDLHPELPVSASPWLRAMHELRQPLQAARLLVDVGMASPALEARTNARVLLGACLANLTSMLDQLEHLEQRELGLQGEAVCSIGCEVLLSEASDRLNGVCPGSTVTWSIAASEAPVVLVPPEVGVAIVAGVMANVAHVQARQAWSAVRTGDGGAIELATWCDEASGIARLEDAFFVELARGLEAPNAPPIVAGLGLVRRLARSIGGDVALEVRGAGAQVGVRLPA